jgi:RNA polymerase sigma factor (sigma-70 family)
VTVKPDRVEQAFDLFVRADGQRLRRVMISQYGLEIGCESTDAALAWAWEHWDRLDGIANRAGYLYRVAQTQARRAINRGRPVMFPDEPRRTTEPGSSEVDGDLAEALRRLPDRQRVAVVLVHVFGWTPSEVGEITGVAPATIRSHLRRGLRQLRRSLKGNNE